jgi:hypothetical protein
MRDEVLRIRNKIDLLSESINHRSANRIKTRRDSTRNWMLTDFWDWKL